MFITCFIISQIGRGNNPSAEILFLPNSPLRTTEKIRRGVFWYKSCPRGENSALFLHPRREQGTTLLAEQGNHLPQGLGLQLHPLTQTGGAEDVGGLFVHQLVLVLHMQS